MLAALFGAKLFNGAEAVLSAIDFNEKIRNAQFVITGEGCFDRTSTESGKAVSAVINACRKTGIKCCVLAGCRSPEMDIDEKSVIKVITAYDKTVAENELKATAQSRFIAAAEELFKSIAKGV
jgi:glycerate kinase